MLITKVKRILSQDEAKKKYNKHVVKEISDNVIFVKENGLYVDEDTGEILFFYYVGAPNATVEKVREACLTLKGYNKTDRTSGIPTVDAIFGYTPADGIKRNYCSSGKMARDEKTQHTYFLNGANYLNNLYKEVLPEHYNSHKEQTDKVLDEWRIDDTVFTSGIVNKNTQLPYHLDSGNFDNIFSNMIGFKFGTTGGHLHIPEYNVLLEIADKSVSMFDGQKLVHGVTPIKKVHKDAYRFTVVYYSLKRMWKCETFDKEIQRANDIKTQVTNKKL